MYIVTNITKITKGEGYKLVNRFNKEGKVETMNGFLGLEVLSTQKLNEYDEVSIVTRWDSEGSFKNWTKSNSFKQAHQHKEGKPDYIISNSIAYYEVEVTRNPIVAL